MNIQEANEAKGIIRRFTKVACTVGAYKDRNFSVTVLNDGSQSVDCKCKHSLTHSLKASSDPHTSILGCPLQLKVQLPSSTQWPLGASFQRLSSCHTSLGSSCSLKVQLDSMTSSTLCLSGLHNCLI